MSTSEQNPQEQIEALKKRLAQLEGALWEIRSWNPLGNTLPGQEAGGSEGVRAQNAQLKVDSEALDDRGSREFLEYLRTVRTICENVGLHVDNESNPAWDVTP